VHRVGRVLVFFIMLVNCLNWGAVFFETVYWCEVESLVSRINELRNAR